MSYFVARKNDISGSDADGIRGVVTYDSIAIYWQKPGETVEKYELYLDGVLFGETEKTHYEFRELMPETMYTIKIKAIYGNASGAGWGYDDRQGADVEQDCRDSQRSDAAQDFGELCLTTEKAGRRIDVTRAPYCAAGDGKTMDTAAIQKALDDCGVGETVYLPAGTYLTGALRLHSDMELYLEEGAVLQGTDKPEDYLPRIWSRFEGIEQECYSSYLNLGELNHCQRWQKSCGEGDRF